MSVKPEEAQLPKTTHGAICRAKRPQPLQKTSVCRVLPDAESVWSVSTPDVPFCADVASSTVVVLAHCSVLGRRREIADSACTEIRRYYQSLRQPEPVMCAGEVHPLTPMLPKLLRNNLSAVDPGRLQHHD